MTSLPIILPVNSNVIVSVGDKVKAGQIIAEKKSSQVGKILPIAKTLSVAPKTAIKYLKKRMGDRVEKGEVLAEKKGVMSGKKILSPFSGTVFKLEEETGDLYIVTEEQGKEKGENIFSPVEGKVVFCDNTKIVLETDKKAMSAEKATGDSAQGELFLIEDEDIDYNEIPEKVSEKIILGKKFEKAAIYKSVAMGSIGIICEEVDDADFNEYREKQIKNPILQVNGEDFIKLTKLDGKIIFLEPDKKLILL